MSGVYLVKVTDLSLRSQVLQTLIGEVLGDDDRSLALESFEVPKRRGSDDAADDDLDPAGDDREAREAREGPPPVVAGVVNAAQSPPFVTASRVVVVADYEQLTAAEAEPIVSVLDDLLDTTTLIFVSGGGRAPKNLADALKSATAVGTDSEKTQDVLAAELERHGLSFRNDASALVIEHLGDDAGRVSGLLDVVGSMFGPDATVTASDIEPYLNETGSVPIYQLTNQIEDGDVAGSLETIHRLLTVTSSKQPKAYHPLQVLATLASRYRKLLIVDSPDIRTEADAHAALGGKGSTYPSKKSLSASRALGTDGIRQAIDYLHRADIELKGATGLKEDLIMEVLIARLAALHGRSRNAGRRRREPAGRPR